MDASEHEMRASGGGGSSIKRGGGPLIVAILESCDYDHGWCRGRKWRKDHKKRMAMDDWLVIVTKDSEWEQKKDDDEEEEKDGEKGVPKLCLLILLHPPNIDENRHVWVTDDKYKSPSHPVSWWHSLGHDHHLQPLTQEYRVLLATRWSS